MAEFITDTVLKRDVFSETRIVHFADAPDRRFIRRLVSASPIWSRPLAWFLARREVRALKAAHGIAGTPQLISTDRDGLCRTWIEGTPLHLARPADRAWYDSARRILRNLRRCGITHNDLAKPQNWLVTPEGTAAVIDFQLASLHQRRGWLLRVMAYEDLRHLLKQKSAFARGLMTATERRILARRSLPSRIWRATGKKLYNIVTRRFLNWSDGEGTGDRIDKEGPALRAALKSDPRVTDVAFALFSLPAKGVGLYVFVETEAMNERALRALISGFKVELLQPVKKLPRRGDGAVRSDLLQLISLNQITEIGDVITDGPEMAAIVRDIVDNRRNFNDRRVNQLEG